MIFRALIWVNDKATFAFTSKAPSVERAGLDTVRAWLETEPIIHSMVEMDIQMGGTVFHHRIDLNPRYGAVSNAATFCEEVWAELMDEEAA